MIKPTSHKIHMIKRTREKIQRNTPRKFTKKTNKIKNNQQSLKNSVNKKQ